MPVELWIDDGSPWYMSPDIWVVPGMDPEAGPGVPIAEHPAWIWARVHNRGDRRAANVTVKYYWANPSTAVTVESATLVGTSFANIDPGESREVLCVTPWTPTWVNDGHECVIVEAFSSVDPVLHGTTGPFQVRADRHVAQRNLHVLQVSPLMSLAAIPFAVANAAHFHSAAIEVRVERDKIARLEPLMQTLGLDALPEESKGLTTFGVRPYRCGEKATDVGKQKLKIESPAPSRLPLALLVDTSRRTSGGAFFRIEQFADGELVGGVGALLIAEEGV